MKRILFFLAFVLTASFGARASHILGGDIQYKYVGDSTGVLNQYRIKLVIYWEQTAFDPGATQTVTIRSASCNINTNLTVTRPGAAFSAASLGAYDCIAQGANSSQYNPMVNVYWGYVVLPQVCNDYYMYWQTCCRVGNITSLVNSFGDGFYFETELNNTLGKNSSPSFVSIPLSYICIGGYTN
jgi:hypothetical protein